MLQKRLLSLLLLWSVFLLASLPLSAQTDEFDLSESFVTEGGIGVRFPDGWFAESSAPEILDLTNLGSFYNLGIHVGGELSDINGHPETDALAMVEEYREGLRIIVTGEVAEIETVNLPNGTAYLWLYPLLSATPDNGIVGIQLLNGETVGVLVTIFGGSDGFNGVREETLAILGTLETGAEFIAEAAVVLPLIAADDLPDNAYILAGDIAFVLPEGYENLTEEEGAEMVTLLTEDFSTRVIQVGVLEESAYALFRSTQLGSIVPAMMDGTVDFDEVVETIPLDDGREILFYTSSSDTSAEIIETDEDTLGSVIGVYAEFNVAADSVLYITGTSYEPADLESLEAEVMAIAGSVAIIEGGASDMGEVAAESGSQPTEIAPSPTPEPAPEAEGSVANPIDMTCGESVIFYSPELTGSVQVACPAGCTPNSGAIWGSSPYTNDSSVCVAALHAGVITEAAGGTVTVTFSEGLESYPATTANGVTSYEFGPYTGSITLSAGE